MKWLDLTKWLTPQLKESLLVSDEWFDDYIDRLKKRNTEDTFKREFKETI